MAPQRLFRNILKSGQNNIHNIHALNKTISFSRGKVKTMNLYFLVTPCYIFGVIMAGDLVQVTEDIMRHARRKILNRRIKYDHVPNRYLYRGHHLGRLPSDKATFGPAVKMLPINQSVPSRIILRDNNLFLTLW